MKNIKKILSVALSLILLAGAVKSAFWVKRKLDENRILKEVVYRLSADSRIAEVLVTKSIFNEKTQAIDTTIKFLEYDSHGNPLAPRYFTFQGNLIQFQALVIRFQDPLVQAGDKLRGKSAYIFLKAFVLDDHHTQVFHLAEVDQIPAGYKIKGVENDFERRLWEEFWTYALKGEDRERSKIKSAQIEAPGSMFLPGTIYTLNIEHDGGIRIDTKPVPEILKGESV